MLAALTAIVGVSCANNVQEDINVSEPSVRSVVFSGSMISTKTGLTMQIIPDWRKTDNSVVHLFEDLNGEVLEGRDPVITTGIDGDYGSASFKAEFSEDISIIVTPPSNAPATKAGDEFKYSAIISQKADGKYIVPSVQYPDVDTWIDPAADFLVADGQISSVSLSGKNVDLDFKRPVSISRFAFTGLKGEYVKSVKITAESGLTGKAEYSDVNFQTGEVAWDTAESSTIELKYGEGRPMATTFYAFFISLPGNVKIYSVEVVTDQYVFTKTFEGGKTLKFDLNTFKNIACDYHDVTPVPVGDTPVDQELSFFKDGGTITSDSYDLYSMTAYVTPEVKGAAAGATITLTSENESVAIIESGAVKPVAVGEAVITATASAVDGYNETSVSYTLTVSDSTPAPQVIVLNRATTVSDGASYIMVNNGKALQNNAGAFGAVDVELSQDRSTVSIASDIDLTALAWTWNSSSLSTSYGKYTVTNGEDYLYVTGSYSSGYTCSIGNYGTTDVKYVVWNYDSSQVQNGSSSHRYLTYNNGWTVPTSKSSHDTYLYEYVDQRTAQNLSFSSSEAEYDLGTSTYTKPLPTLSGAQTSVTWSSSNPEIASVDNNGNVTPLKVGQVTITAKAAGSKTFKPAEAKYTLSVINSTIKVSTYVKVTGELEDWSGTYLFVKESANAAFAYNQNNFKTSVVISNGQIVSDDYKAYELTVSASTMGAGKYDITTAGSPKMYVYSYGNTFLYESNINSGNQYCATFTFGNGGVSVMCQRSGGSENYMLYENGAFNFVRNPSTTPEPIQLYKLDDGSSPTPPTPPVSTEKTYTKVTNSISEGTYLICGYESAGTYVCLFPPISASNKSFGTSNKCNHNLFSSSNTITEIKTSDESIIASEVELTKSGNNWLVKLKSSGEYFLTLSMRHPFDVSQSSVSMR